MLIRSAMLAPEAFDLYLDTAHSLDTDRNLLGGATEAENGVSERNSSSDADNLADIDIDQTAAHAKTQLEGCDTVGDGKYGSGVTSGKQAVVEQAQELLEEEFRAAREEGRRLGYADGFGEGKARAFSEHEQQIARMQSLLGSVGAALVSGVQGSEEIAVEIAFAAIRKIMGAQLATREGTIAVVREAITHVGTHELVVVRVSPEDRALLNDVLVSVPVRAGCPQVEVIADERVVLGGCLLETAGGSLDARLEAQLTQLRDSLLRARDEHKASPVSGRP